MKMCMREGCRLFLIFVFLLLAVPVASLAFDGEKLRAIEAAIEETIADKKTPGGVFWLERGDKAFQVAIGNRALEPEEEAATIDTIYDVASLTKVIATTTAIAVLHERGALDLDAPVVTYIPEFAANGKEAVTIQQLLTHTSGLRPGISLPSSYENAVERACAEALQNEPGKRFVYSDINFILLGEIVARVSGDSLDVFSKNEIFEPLRMNDTRFLPDTDQLSRIAPTQRTGGKMLRGVVHDPTARAMGGIAGHAGLFSTAPDLARFARMLLNKGELDGVRLLKPETIALFTTVQTPETVQGRRGFGWDIETSYSSPRGELFPIGSYGHTGWTGPSFWVDPFSETFWIFVNNRVHPDGKGNVVPLRRVIATLAAESITDYDFANVPGALLPQEEENRVD